MFTSVDKAIVALVMSLVYLANYFFGLTIPGLTADAFAALVAALGPFLVWLVPNKGFVKVEDKVS